MLADHVNIELSRERLGPGLRWVSDAYHLRDTIRKAKHFRLDARASGYVADASIAIADHLDEAREMARSPYPVVWIDIDNPARLSRIKSHGIGLTSRAAGGIDGAPVDSVGWLIERHPTQHSAFRASYFTEVEEGVVMMPLAWAWDCDGNSCPWPHLRMINQEKLGMSELDFLFGVRGAICTASWAIGGWVDTLNPHSTQTSLIREVVGELRHIFGFLVTIGSLPVEYVDIPHIDGDLSQPVPVIKGKPVYALVHRDVMIRVPKRRELTKIITRLCEGMRKRRHDVRGHWRSFYNADGSLRRKVWVRNHERGDLSLGRVEHGYRISA